MGRPAPNASPARFFFLTTPGAKPLLKLVLAPGNVDKTMAESAGSSVWMKSWRHTVARKKESHRQNYRDYLWILQRLHRPLLLLKSLQSAATTIQTTVAEKSSTVSQTPLQPAKISLTRVQRFHRPLQCILLFHI